MTSTVFGLIWFVLFLCWIFIRGRMESLGDDDNSIFHLANRRWFGMGDVKHKIPEGISYVDFMTLQSNLNTLFVLLVTQKRLAKCG